MWKPKVRKRSYPETLRSAIPAQGRLFLLLIPRSGGLNTNEPLVNRISLDLMAYKINMPGFPSDVLGKLTGLSNTLGALSSLFENRTSPMTNENNTAGRIVADIDLICSVLQTASGSVTEMIEQAKQIDTSGEPPAEIPDVMRSGHQRIWDDYNSHMKSSQGFDLLSFFELCRNFVKRIEDMLIEDIDPSNLADMRAKLEGYRLKMTGASHQGLFDEVLYTREFHRENKVRSRTDAIQAHTIPSLVSRRIFLQY